MADTTNRVAGTAYLTVNGVNYALVGEFGYMAGSVTRETATGLDGVHGYIEKPTAGVIFGTCRDQAGLAVGSTFNGMTNVTVIAELANGKTVVGRNMWTVETQEVGADDGTFKVRFEGFDGSVTEN